MITGLRISIGFFLLVLATSGSLPAQELPREKRDVEVKVFLVDIEEINNVSQSFVANLVLVSRWRGDLPPAVLGQFFPTTPTAGFSIRLATAAIQTGRSRVWVRR
jgi:hypothetical protein